MKILAILIGKITLLFGNILNRGSSLPGKLALTCDKNLLKKFKISGVKIAVTGSSGKGSTAALIANTLKNTKASVCYNKAGSNLAWGITSTLLEFSTISGKLKCDYLVLEVDERYTKTIFKYLKPDYIVITNLTKDQPPRNFHIDHVYNEIKEAIPSNSTILTCMDDPYLRNFEKDLPNEVIYCSLNKNKYSYHEQIFENLNTYYCPYCKHELEYSYYNFETMGKYNCPNCSFKHESSCVHATKLDLENKTITIDNYKIKLVGSMLYDAYNTLYAYNLLKELKIPKETIATNLSLSITDKTKENFTSYGKNYYLLNCKCENATTFNQALFKVRADESLKDVIIGWREITRRYPHHDISWIYDITFELLNDSNLNKVYVIGVSNKDLEKRLILANIPEDKIEVANNLEEIKKEIEKSKVQSVYGILNYDYDNPFPFTNTFKEGEN